MSINTGPTGAKVYDNQYTHGAIAQVTPDEMDQYMMFEISNPGTSQTAIGTAPVGTSTTSQTFVITNIRPDYPRNLLFGISGSNNLGGTATVNGFDQFGNVQSESIGFGTVASPGTQAAGTKIFGQVVSASMTFASGSAGSGTPVLGYASGTAAGLKNLFGLPTKIASASDIKLLTWINNGTTTALNGGTIGTALVNTASHSFMGTHTVALTDNYQVWIKSTWDNSGAGKTSMSHLPGTP